MSAPISTDGQIPLFCQAVRTPSCHRTFLPCARHDFRYLPHTPYLPRLHDKSIPPLSHENTTECILYPLLYFCLCVTTLLKDIPVNSCLKCTCHLFFPLHKILFFYYYHICFFIQILPNPSLLFPIYCEKCPAFRRSIFTRLF